MPRIFWLLALPMAVWAQLGDNTVTVTASRQLPSLQPDEAVFGVYVTAPGSASLNDVLAVLASTGITAANLSGATSVYNPLASNPATQWNFTLTVALAQLGPTIAALGAATTASSVQVSYSVSAQVSPQSQASQQCPYALLVGEAQGQAQTLAAAAGATVGPILWVSDGTSLGAGTAASRTGSFTEVVYAAQVGVISNILGVPQAASPACTMTVQFSLVN